MKEIIKILIGTALSFFKAYVIVLIWKWYFINITGVTLAIIPVFIGLHLYNLIITSGKDAIFYKNLEEEENIYLLSYSFASSLLLLVFGFVLK